MARRDQDQEDYLNLGQARGADEFAIGEPGPEPDPTDSRSPRALFILPMVTIFTVLIAFLVGFFIFRAWDRTPVLDVYQQEVRVSEPDSKQPFSTEIDKKSAVIASNGNSATPAPASKPSALTAPVEPALRSVSAVLPELIPAIGMVVVRTATGISSGSGFVIREDGLFVTNFHVIKGAEDFAIKLNNSSRINTAFILSTDEEKDLAILRFKEAGPYPVLALEDVAQPDLGEEVLVLGYPLGTKLGLELTVSTGIVSSLRNYPEISLIQTNAAINHGNSGGPMIYRRTGRVIGIVTAKARDSESIGFAINVKELKKILDK